MNVESQCWKLDPLLWAGLVHRQVWKVPASLLMQRQGGDSLPGAQKPVLCSLAPRLPQDSPWRDSYRMGLGRANSHKAVSLSSCEIADFEDDTCSSGHTNIWGKGTRVPLTYLSPGQGWWRSIKPVWEGWLFLWTWLSSCVAKWTWF